MCAILVFTLAADTRSAHLGESVDVDGLYAESLLEFLAHTLGPRFGAEESHLEFQVFLLHCLALLDHLGKMQGIRRSTAEDGGAEVFHEHDLLLGVACRRGQLDGTEQSGSIVGTKTAGEESVAVAHLYDVALGDA